MFKHSFDSFEYLSDWRFWPELKVYENHLPLKRYHLPVKAEISESNEEACKVSIFPQILP